MANSPWKDKLFDPKLVDAFLENLDAIKKVYERW